MQTTDPDRSGCADAGAHVVRLRDRALAHAGAAGGRRRQPGAPRDGAQPAGHRHRAGPERAGAPSCPDAARIRLAKPQHGDRHVVFLPLLFTLLLRHRSHSLGVAWAGQ